MDARRLVPVVLTGVILAGCAAKAPTPPPTATATASPTATLAPTPTPTPSPTPTATPEPTPTAPPTLPAAAWKAYTAADKTWKVSFPGDPLSATMPIDSGSVKTTATYWVVMASMDAGYFVMTADFPASSVKGATTELLYDAMEMGMTRSIPDARVAASENVTVSGHPARATQLVGSGKTLNLVLTLVKTRMYILMVMSSTGQDLETNHFVESFQILK